MRKSAAQIRRIAEAAKDNAQRDIPATQIRNQLPATTLPPGGPGGSGYPPADDSVTTGKLDDDAVTFAKMQNIATDRLIGRDTASTGDPEQLTVGGGVEFTGSGGIQRSALTGDVTASAGSNSTTIPNDTVTYAKMQNVSAASKLIGRGDSGSGDPQEITLGSGLSMSGTTLDATGGGSALTVEEVDGSPTDSAVTKIVFPNGTLGIASHVATYTPAGGGGTAPDSADYWVETANGSLSAEVVVGTTGITTAAYASRQAAAKAGRLFLPNDGFYLERDAGAAYVPWGPIYPLVAPPTSGWSWVNQGSATVDTTYGGIYLEAPTLAGHNYRMRTRTTPSTPYVITAAILPNCAGQDTAWYGVLWRESGSGKIVSIGILWSGGCNFSVSKMSDPATFSAHYTSNGMRAAPSITLAFLRIADNGTNRICSWSMDGQHFMQYHTVGRTDFITPDEVGIFVSPNNTIFPLGVTLLSWKEA